ncbi:hypothetical protein KGY71_01740 [Candidatus Bipolaricaulota bacterium]|nr:hypothetical protein [Candidatus Bipolaricaulota bacterium]
MRYERDTPVLILTILLISGLVVLGSSQEYRAETRLEADRLVISAETTVAEGNVRLTRPEWSLNSDYLELNEKDDTDGLNARGNVRVKSEEFSIRTERLTGKLPEEETGEPLELTLFKADGKSNSVSFSGEKIGLGIEKGELVSLTILSNAELSLSEDSSLEGNDIRAKKVESGWDFEATGEPKYESDSTKLWAETITGTAFTETEDARQGRSSTSQEAIAKGNVRLTRPGWSLNSDYLELKGDGEPQELSAEGAVRVTFGKNSYLSGDEASLSKVEEGWNLEVSENTEFERKTTRLSADRIAGRISSSTEDEIKLSNITAEGISGRIELTGTGGEAEKVQVLGETATLEFDSSSGLSRANFDRGSFTTCEGCQCDGGCAYSISADRTSLIEGDFVLARNANLKSFGIPVGWSPLYFLTLKDVGLPKRPYFPELGYSSEDGLSLSGAFPVFLDKNHFGNVLLDYFSRHQGLGLGLDYYSGGNTIIGVGEIYGVYRAFGDNFYKLDGAFEVNPADWIRISTDLAIEQGEFRGGDYDQNEWSLGLAGRDYGLNWKALVSRTENEEETDHAIERLPEFSLSREEALENLPLKYGLRTSIGYYRENKGDWSTVRSGGRGEIGGDFRVNAPQIGPFDLSLKGEGRVNPYYMESGEEISTRAWANLEPGLKIEGPGTLDLRFVHQEGFGETPFEFDAVERRDRFTLNYESSQGIFDQSLSFHYDFVPYDGFSNAKYRISFRKDSLDQKFTVNYEISEASLSSIKTESTYSIEEFEFNLSSGYNFNEDSISETTLGLKFSSERTTGGIQLKSDPLETWLKKVSGELDLEFFNSWSLSLEGEYDVQEGKLSSLSYSLHKALQNCLKVGITGSKSGFWFDVELVDF